MFPDIKFTPLSWGHSINQQSAVLGLSRASNLATWGSCFWKRAGKGVLNPKLNLMQVRSQPRPIMKDLIFAVSVQVAAALIFQWDTPVKFCQRLPIRVSITDLCHLLEKHLEGIPTKDVSCGLQVEWYFHMGFWVFLRSEVWSICISAGDGPQWHVKSRNIAWILLNFVEQQMLWSCIPFGIKVQV